MELIDIHDINPNPNNPRIIKDDKFNKLVQSLKSFPEMAKVRPIVVNKDMIVLGGNMRLKAMKEAGWKEAPVHISKIDEMGAGMYKGKKITLSERKICAGSVKAAQQATSLQEGFESTPALNKTGN